MLVLQQLCKILNIKKEKEIKTLKFTQMKKLPRYDVRINETDETGLEFNSLVENPAHGKEFIMFSKDSNYFFDEKSKTIIGCAIAADEDIYRNSESIGKRYI